MLGFVCVQIGLPNPNLMEGMEAEHCKREDSKDEFNPGNYDTTTTPAAEWGVVTDESKGRQVTAGPRRVRSLKELMEHPLSVEAGLVKEELIAMMLYTGPLFVKYNAVLRDFPKASVDALKGNTYTTTIYCIVSGIIKLSKVMRLPDNRMVYRGMGGLDLPESFLEQDKWRISGGVEYGILSTTTDRCGLRWLSVSPPRPRPCLVLTARGECMWKREGTAPRDGGAVRVSC